AEGFFGTLKQEFFYARDWKGTTKGSFVRALDEYIVWYRDEKIKRSLGWKTIAAHRAALAAAA
ncbi:integrase, partial [Eggerthella lenta]